MTGNFLSCFKASRHLETSGPEEVTPSRAAASAAFFAPSNNSIKSLSIVPKILSSKNKAPTQTDPSRLRTKTIQNLSRMEKRVRRIQRCSAEPRLSRDEEDRDYGLKLCSLFIYTTETKRSTVSVKNLGESTVSITWLGLWILLDSRFLLFLLNPRLLHQPWA